MKSTLQKIFDNLHIKNNENSISFLLYSTIFIICSSLIVNTSLLYWLFEATLQDLKSWYPTFYLVIYLFPKILFLFCLVIAVLQLKILMNQLQLNSRFILFTFIILLVISIFITGHLWLFSLIIIIFRVFYKKSSVQIFNKENSLVYKDKWILFTFIMVAFIIRLIWIFYTDNSWNGDAPARLYIADTWVQLIRKIGFNSRLFNVSFFIPSIDWLPLHFYLAGIVTGLFNEWEYTPRVLTAVFATLSLIPLYKLCLLKFNRITGIFAIIILTFYGYHILLSSLVLSEVFYIFFVLYAYYFIEKWSVTNNNKILFRLAFTLICLCLLRFEGWFFTGVIIVLLPFVKKIEDKMSYFNFVVLALFPIMLIMYGEILHGEHPLRGIFYSDFEVKVKLLNNPLTLKNILFQYAESYIPLVFTSLLLVIFSFFRNKNRREILLFILYVLPLLPFLYKTFNGTLTAQSRYMTLYMVPLIPFLAFLFYKLWCSVQKWKFIFLFGLYLLILNFSMCLGLKYSPNSLRYNSGFRESVEYVKNMNTGYFYVDNEINYGSGNWIVLSRINNHQLNRAKIGKLGLNTEIVSEFKVYKKSAISNVDFDSDIETKWNDKIFDDLLDLGTITHIMLFPEGKLSNKLNFTSDRESYRRKIFIRLFNKDGYSVYQIENSIE